MKLRESWYRPEGAPVCESVCIWCLRQASLCVIVDPCADREQFEAKQVSFGGTRRARVYTDEDHQVWSDQ